MGKTQEMPSDSVNLTPTIMAQAVVARATDNSPTYGVDVMGITGLSQGNVSKVLAGMRESGQADYGPYYQKSAGSGRAVAPIIGTDLLSERVGEDAHLQRAVGILDFAERTGLTPGEALDELLRIGRAALETPNPVAPIPGDQS